MASPDREKGSRSDLRPADVENTGVRISVKTDYAIRAAAELAVLGQDGPVKAQLVGARQDIPLKFLLNILGDLRRAGVVRATRGVNGGYQLARAADDITLAEVIRAVEGPLANVHESRPEELSYSGPSEPLKDVWIAVRASLRSVLEHVTVGDLASGKLPRAVTGLLQQPEAFLSH
jgi:Rrf2 family protein